MQNEILGGFTQFQRQSHCFLWFKFLVIYPPSHSKRSWKGVFFQTWKHDFAEWCVLFSFPLCFPSFTLLRLLAPCKPSWSSTYFCFIEKKKHQYLEHHLIFTQASPHRPGRPLRINFMSRYICFSQIGPFDVSFEELFSKVQNPGGFFRKIVF